MTEPRIPPKSCEPAMEAAELETTLSNLNRQCSDKSGQPGYIAFNRRRQNVLCLIREFRPLTISELQALGE